MPLFNIVIVGIKASGSWNIDASIIQAGSLAEVIRSVRGVARIAVESGKYKRAETAAYKINSDEIRSMLSVEPKSARCTRDDGKFAQLSVTQALEPTDVVTFDEWKSRVFADN